MKLKVITGYSLDAGEFTLADIQFCGDKVGQGTALIPIKLSDSLTPTARIDLTTGTSVSKKGLISAVIKVSVPYFSVQPDANGVPTIDPKRVGYNSFHTVVNVCKACAEDLRGVNGPVAQEHAVKQLLTPKAIHNMIAGPAIGGPTGSWYMNADASVYPPYFDGSVNSHTPEGVKREDPVADGKITWPTFNNSGVLDVTAANPAMTTDSPLARIVNGLTPVGCEDADARYARFTPPMGD